MKYISNKKFSKTLVEWFDNPNDLLSLLKVSLFLSKKYWKKVFLSNFSYLLKEVDEDIYSFILLLDKYWKYTTDSISKLIVLVKELTNYKKSFDLISWDNVSYQEVLDSLNKNFWDCELDSFKSKDLWIFVKWEGSYYKRNLEKDIDKLLS